MMSQTIVNCITANTCWILYCHWIPLQELTSIKLWLLQTFTETIYIFHLCLKIHTEDQKKRHWCSGQNNIIQSCLHWQTSNRQQLRWKRWQQSSGTRTTTCETSAVSSLPCRHRWSLELHSLCSPDLQSHTQTPYQQSVTGVPRLIFVLRF